MQSFLAHTAHPYYRTIRVAIGTSESSLRYQRNIKKIGVGRHGPSSMLYEGVVRRNSRRSDYM